MRRTMLDVAGFGAEAMARNQLRPPKVMIAIGGMEGILDEARILRESGRQTPIYAFVSGGGAAKRLVREVPGVHDLEAEFRVAHADYLPRGMRFPPYAAIAQWLLDRRIIDAVPD